jgi:modulator of FtsH protease
VIDSPGPEVSSWIAFQEHWHEFFLMTGTAAVTLAGLLFVAISLNLDTLIHPSRAHLLALSRSILLSYVIVLTFSLMMLVPSQPLRPVAVETIAVGVVAFVITARQLRTSGVVDHPEFPHRVFRRRLIPMLIGYVMVAATGAGLLLTRVPDMFYLVIGALCMLLGNATGASWDLLVRTAKVRRSEAEASE